MKILFFSIASCEANSRSREKNLVKKFYITSIDVKIFLSTHLLYCVLQNKYRGQVKVMHRVKKKIKIMERVYEILLRTKCLESFLSMWYSRAN